MILPKLPLEFALTTPRLLLRRVREADALDMNQAIHASAPQLQPWLHWSHPLPTVPQSHLYILENLVKWHVGKHFDIALLDKTNGRFLGLVGLTHTTNAPAYEIEYWLHSAQDGRGFATEAVQAITQSAFQDLQAQRVVIRANSQNSPSQRVAVKLGYVLEGVARNEQQTAAGELEDMHHYVHTPGSWVRVQANIQAESLADTAGNLG